MKRALFVTHAEVVIDPAVPVPDWGLSPRGRMRHAAFAASTEAADVTAVYCSAERKAREGAEILAEALGLVPVVLEALGENDRSGTGFLPPDEFQAVADRFFARPQESVRGWERAVDAQRRIVGAVGSLLRADAGAGSVAIVAHGGVGALLLAWLLRSPISRHLDQPGSGGGNFFAFSPGTEGVIHGWRDIAAGEAPEPDGKDRATECGRVEC